MSFQPRFGYTHGMVRNLGLIESARAVVDVLPLPPDQVLRLRQAARQRATRNSTRIEGNTLTIVEVDRAIVATDRTPGEMQQEVRNYWRALEWIEDQLEARRPISEEYIRELHCLIEVRGIGRRGQRSDFRADECPVIDAATRRVDYAPPKPEDVSALMRDLAAWWRGNEAAELPGPVRAGLLAHRFVSIHPFSDGNGRTARALATAELWRGGYDMRGFLSLEEYYTADLQAYYDSLQMGLPIDFYDGRHDPDHTPWLEYFLATMARAAEELRKKAIALYNPESHPSPPWESLRRVQQQLLTRLMMRGASEGTDQLAFTPGNVAEWFDVSANTAREWLERWRDEGFVEPSRAEAQRIRTYVLTAPWLQIVQSALNNTSPKTS